MTTQAKVITANILIDGVTVYLDEAGNWTPMLSRAHLVADGAEQARLMRQAEEHVRRLVVVDPYAMDAAPGADGPQPLSQRERIRASGPTIQYVFS